ncbi:MAG: hypothetical protein J5857_06550, partial [Treponema sp.]|nr:hypothetical protein [Treponema sp.]
METTGNNFIEVKEMAENYIIEGTVSEISSEKPEEVNFKIFGTEGYALKIGKNKYNILCSETILKNAADDSTTKDESKIYSETFILSQQILFTSTDTAKVGI